MGKRNPGVVLHASTLMSTANGTEECQLEGFHPYLLANGSSLYEHISKPPFELSADWKRCCCSCGSSSYRMAVLPLFYVPKNVYVNNIENKLTYFNIKWSQALSHTLSSLCFIPMGSRSAEGDKVRGSRNTYMLAGGLATLSVECSSPPEKPTLGLELDEGWCRLLF